MTGDRCFQLISYLILACAALPATADSISLRLPLDCDFAQQCQIQNHFDHDPGPGFRDYACGHLGYDGHNGVDLRLPNLAVMRAGVTVVAAAPGRVRAVRDDMTDANVNEIGREAIKGREAGNAVVIRHGEDWETQYSHLRRGSVQVKPGDAVQAGQALGLVGLSGKTEFPHLHFTVRYRGKPVDPFVGLQREARCGVGDEPLWNEQALRVLDYRPTGLVQAGFAAEAPRITGIERGQYGASELAARAPALAFWVEVFGVQQGDQEWIQLVAPDAAVLAEKRVTLPRNLARRHSYVGKRRSQDAWPAGDYRGRYRLMREQAGQPAAVIDQELVLRIR